MCGSRRQRAGRLDLGCGVLAWLVRVTWRVSIVGRRSLSPTRFISRDNCRRKWYHAWNCWWRCT